MKDCSKRQHESYKGTPRERCINEEASAYLQVVNETICDSCPVRVFAKNTGCPKKAYVPSPAPPPLGLTYVGQLEDMVDLKPQQSHEGFPDCPYRILKEQGLTCEVTGLTVTPEICFRCHKETTLEAKKKEAHMGNKVWNYFEAIRKWVAAGRPVRTKEEIATLFAEHCNNGCDRYDKEKHACKSCGCVVAAEGSPLDNKLAMATEHCPLGRF